jgi:serine/threonine-protein kinase
VDAEFGRTVALKCVRPDRAGQPGSLDRFRREAEITARLEHPGIVPVYGLTRDAADQPAYAMRFVEGQTLKEAIDRYQAGPPDPLAFRQLLGHFVAACNAVAYAHSRGVLHRDLKPANILLGKYGETLVVDWGLAKVVGRTEATHTDVEDTLATQTAALGDATLLGQAAGTPAYMSPEQAAGRWDVVGPASDVYGLGATLYYLLTGRAPFCEGELGQVLFQVQQGEFAAPRQVKAGVPPALDAVCLKAMARRPDDRYATAGDLAREVERWLADEPTLAYRESWAERFRRRVRRHAVLAAAATALLATAVIGLTLGLAAVRRERDDKDRALAAETQAREEAEKTRRQALAALRSLTDDVVQRQLAQREQLTEEERAFLLTIASHYEGLAALQGDSAEARSIRAEGQGRVGYVRLLLGEWKGAEAALRDATALQEQMVAEFPARPEYLRDLAWTYSILGQILFQTGQSAEAEAALRQCIALERHLAAAFPSDPTYRHGLATPLNDLGIMLRGLGRAREAETAYTEALQLGTQLVADFPDRPVYRRGLGLYHSNLANLLYEAGRTPDAETHHREAIALQSRLVEEFPTRPRPRMELAQTYHNLGVLLVGRRLPEAEAAYRKALELRARLAAEFPAQPQHRQNLARTQSNLGVLFSESQRPAEAETLFRDALVVERRLVADFPRMPDYHQDLAGTLAGLADLLRGRRQFVEARQCLDQAEREIQTALKTRPGDPQYRRFCAFLLIALARTCAGQGEHEGALGAAHRIRDLGWEAANDAYNAARALASCAAAADGDKSAPDYAGRAMDLLRQAVGRGFTEVTRLKRQEDFNPLRQRKDFKQLVAELEAKAKR